MTPVIDERKPETGMKASIGKVTTAGTLGTLASFLVFKWGGKVMGDAVNDPLYFSLANAAVLAVLLNAKLYGMVIIQWAAKRWIPADLWAQLTSVKAAARQPETPAEPTP